MRISWDLKPNLLECILEDRIVPAPMNNLGMIVQTTSGLTLVTPFPGAVNMSAMAGGGSSTTAASVSGTAMPTSMYMTSRGISQFMPGNMTGNPLVGGVAGSSGGVSITIKVGSGADEAGGPVGTTPAMSRTNPAYGGNAPSVMAYIGQPGTSSGTTNGTNVTNPQASAPVPALAPMGVTIPGSPTGAEGPNGSPTNPMGPQLGAPRMLKGLGGSLIPTLPGGLGIGGPGLANPLSPSGAGGY